MRASVCRTDDMLEAASARLYRDGYAVMPWGRRERAAIATEALRRAVAVLREGGEGVTHPLGFARIPLSLWALERPRIAVHIWNGKCPAANSLDIHDHCYDFASICIVGQVRHTFYEQGPSAEALTCNMLQYRAGCCADGESGSAESQQLTPVSAQTVGPYDGLLLDHQSLHQSQSLTDVAVTVQFQSPCIKPMARVFRAASPQTFVESGGVESLSRERLELLLERAGQ